MSILVSLLIQMSPMAQAADFPGCTDWKAERGVSCVFAGEDSKVWKRDCSAAEEDFQCRRNPGNNPPSKPCLSERVCFDYNPSQFESDCSEWVRERGVKCAVSGKPVVWRRACQWEVLPTMACTKSGNRLPTKDDYIYW